MLKHLTGPDGIRILLDSAQIFPDDPGAGTPAMVYVGKHAGTYWCALDTGDIDCGGFTLSNAQWNWLDNQFDTVSEFVAVHSK